LTRLLEGLAALETDARLTVIVADNDANGRQGLEAAGMMVRAGYRWPVEAAVVEERGISQVRNTLVARALALREHDFFLAMLDDDEWPRRDWLAELLRVQAETQADIVQGPVLCYFPKPPAPLAVLSNSSRPPRAGSGPIAQATAGGNVLISAASLRRMGPPWFDAQFGLTGGEDKDFFTRMALLGARAAWAEEAVAYTTVPETRMTPDWALKRAFRAGNCDLRILRKYDRSVATLAREAAKLAGALVLSPLAFVAGAADPQKRAQAAFTFARALGKAAVPLGAEYREYRQIHGR
jgi:hypothetical protein